MNAVRERIRLKSRRLAAELARHRRSQNAWAQRLGLSKGYLSQLANGRRRYPSAAVRQRLLEILELSFDDLFERQPARQPGRTKRGPDQPAKRRHPRRHGSRGDGTMSTFWHDLRTTARQLARQPAFTLLAASVLALGIGANATIFSIVDGVLLSPLAFPDPEQLVLLDENHIERGLVRFGVSPGNLEDWQQPKESLAGVAGYLRRSGNLRTAEQPLRVGYAIVSANLFPLLGVEPELGRGFRPTEERPGEDAVVVLSHRFHERYFGGRDPLGETLELDGQPLTVIGVMPDGFAFPSASTELWRPLAVPSVDAGERSGRWLAAIGRLQPQATVSQAEAEMNVLALRLGEEFPESNGGWSVTATPLHSAVVAGVRSPLLMLWATTGLVLLIACANVAHLLLVRAAGRRQELLIRAALGAGRRRLMTLLLAENALLSLIAGVGGAALAVLGVRLLPALASGTLPRAQTVDVDGRVLVFTLTLSLATALVFGLVPALRLSGHALSPALRSSDRQVAGGRLRSTLVVSEVALAAVVLIGAGLLVRSLSAVLNVDPGFDPRGLLSLRVEPPMDVEFGDVDIEVAIQRIMDQRHQTATTFARLLEGIEALPGVESATAINRPPLSGDSWFIKFFVTGRPLAAGDEAPTGLGRVVTPGYFRTLGIPLLAGRALTARDVQGSTQVAVVDRQAASLYWPGEDPVGQRITMGDVPPQLTEQFTFTVVGVVGEVHHNTLETMARPTVYFPFSQATTGHYGDWGMTLMVRTGGAPLDWVPAIRSEVERVLPGLPIFAARSMRDAVDSSVAARRFHLRLSSAFAIVSLLLAAVGIYGVTAYAASRRRREMGIRFALGARSGDVLRQVTREGMIPVAAGLAFGLVGALAATRVLQGFLFGVEPADPLSFAAAAAILAAVGLAACWIPARRAARVDPAVVLRDE